jgi:hypothetical protein
MRHEHASTPVRVSASMYSRSWTSPRAVYRKALGIPDNVPITPNVTCSKIVMYRVPTGEMRPDGPHIFNEEELVTEFFVANRHLFSSYAQGLYNLAFQPRILINKSHGPIWNYKAHISMTFVICDDDGTAGAKMEQDELYMFGAKRKLRRWMDAKTLLICSRCTQNKHSSRHCDPKNKQRCPRCSLLKCVTLPSLWL